MSMRLRTANLSDTAAVTDLLARAYPTLMAASYDADVLAIALPAMTKANAALLLSNTYYVVENGERLVGCGGWTAEKPGSGQFEAGLAHLRHFATDPALARKGIGRSIFDRCALDAAKRNVLRFQAFAGLNAEPFYHRLGLRRLQVIDIPMGPAIRLPSVLMEGPVAQPQG
jgi:N-acetylglutamate synthase-like GNAT family acetyltransferase